MENTFVVYESRVRHDLMPLALGGDLVAGVLAVAFSFYLGVPWASFLTVPALAVNALLFWLLYPRGFQLLEDAIRVKTGGLGGARVLLSAISEVAVEGDLVRVRGGDGSDLLKPTALAEPDEFAARVNARLGHRRAA
jgi:hypothetical protein